jgi:endonuclease/exonuclease/phosphatase family metal-dependent hydrolase
MRCGEIARKARYLAATTGLCAAVIACSDGAATGATDDTQPLDPCQHIANKQLTVFSNNVGIFPDYIVAQYSEKQREKKSKLVEDEEERAALYASVLLEFERDPDVLLLQEIWSIKARDVLIEELAVEYPYFAHPHVIGDDGLQASGLMAFSKYELSNFDFQEFTMGEGLDKASQKGILGVRLNKDGRSIAAFVTHLQAGGNDPAVRPDQLRESNEFIDRFSGNDAAVVRLLAGDLNTASNKDGYQKIFDNMPGAVDSYRAGCGPLEKTGRYSDDPTKRIDYLLTFDGTEAMSTIVDPGGETLADHLAVFGIVALGE